MKRHRVVGQPAEQVGREKSTGESKLPTEVKGNQQQLVRPAWVDDGLFEETRSLWSKRSGRPLSETEVLEILLTVKRMAMVLLKRAHEEES